MDKIRTGSPISLEELSESHLSTYVIGALDNLQLTIILEENLIEEFAGFPLDFIYESIMQILIVICSTTTILGIIGIGIDYQNSFSTRYAIILGAVGIIVGVLTGLFLSLRRNRNHFKI